MAAPILLTNGGLVAGGGAAAGGAAAAPLLPALVGMVILDVVSLYGCNVFTHKYYEEHKCDKNWKGVCWSVGASMHANCATNAVTKLAGVAIVGQTIAGAFNGNSGTHQHSYSNANQQQTNYQQPPNYQQNNHRYTNRQP